MSPSERSDPSAVSFTDASAESTVVTLDFDDGARGGTYTFQLEFSDGCQSGVAERTVEVLCEAEAEVTADVDVEPVCTGVVIVFLSINKRKQKSMSHILSIEREKKIDLRFFPHFSSRVNLILY